VNEWNKGRLLFFDKHNLGYPYNLIHPHKQAAVKHLVDNRPDWVTHIFIFGSSVHTWHMPWKDLDVYLVGTQEVLTSAESKSIRYQDLKYDFLYCQDLQDILEYKEEINHVRGDVVREGVMVYGRH